MPIYRESICYELRPGERAQIAEAMQTCIEAGAPVDDEAFAVVFPGVDERSAGGNAPALMTEALLGAASRVVDAAGLAVIVRQAYPTKNAGHVAITKAFALLLRAYLRTGRRAVAEYPNASEMVARRKIRTALDWLDFVLVAFEEFGKVCVTVECPACGFTTQPCDGDVRICVSCAWVGAR